MPDYNSGGFHQGDDGAIFGDPDGSSNGSVSDYDNWDWKQIKAAVYGMSSGVSTDANLAHARSIANPQSLLDAANAFYHIQLTLEGVTKSLVDQAKALAGDNGPWGGTAADSFLDMMTNFSRQVKANADVLSGGSTGDHSVPHQLANNAIAFQSAQNKLAEIDVFYANEAQQMGVTPMSDGLIPISQKPELVAMMTDDMRAVLKNLAHSYQVTTDAIVNPTPVTSPTDNPNGSGDDNGLPDPNSDPNTDANLGGGSDSGLGDLGDNGNLSDLSGYPNTGLDSGSDSGLGTGDGIGDVGDLASLDGSGDPTSFPGDLGLDGGADSGLGSGDGIGDLGDLGDLGSLDPSAIDSALNPLSFPGLGSLSGLGSSGLGADGESSLGGLSTADPAAFGDTGLNDGLNDGLGNGLTDGLGDGLTDGLASDALSPSQLATSSGMPYMPGMGGTGANGAGLTSEPTDASGLLDSSADPWEGEEAPGDEVGSELGTAAGGEGLGTAGMPYMPAMGGMGGASGAGRDGAGERSDASGLLDGSTEPWEGAEESGDDEAGSPTGALPGVPYLPGFGTTTGPATRATRGRADDRADTSTAENADENADESTAESTDVNADVNAGQGAVEPAAAEGGTAAEPAPGTAPETETATAAAPRTAPVAVGSDGLPLTADHPGDHGDDVDDGAEDFSAWEAGTGAAGFVPLLWALRGDREREADPEQAESAEPRTTWQPDRTATGSPAGTGTAALGEAMCGDGGPAPEEPEAPEESAEAGEEPEEEPAARGIADLLVQHQSTWGTVPGDSTATL
ncbi:WXG100 family type VII secretion target [Streptomyces hyaluromycini]|uniref:WXG100 family type VII secretion target n=1 Tax=Streptomyces hyaluromycini TaxID=1377993 RepID=A0ABV1XAN6_9ACTN